MAKSAFPRDEKLTAISISYTNPDQAMIADKLLPRAKVGTEDFSWTRYPKGQGFTVPRTLIGSKGKAPRIELTGEKVAASTDDVALEIPLTQKDIDNAPAGIDPRGMATEHLTKLLLLDRERMVTNLVQDPAQYSVGNVHDLSADAAADAFNNPASNPIKFLRGLLNAMLMRGNVLGMGLDVWEAIATHPKVVSAALGNDGTEGVATKARVCELLEISEIVVGASRINASKPGQVVALESLWTDQVVAFYRDSTASFQNSAVTFGLTAQVGDRVAGTKIIEAGDMGLKGGEVILAGESVKPLIIAPDCGILLTDCLAFEL